MLWVVWAVVAYLAVRIVQIFERTQVFAGDVFGKHFGVVQLDVSKHGHGGCRVAQVLLMFHRLARRSSAHVVLHGDAASRWSLKPGKEDPQNNINQ